MLLQIRSGESINMLTMGAGGAFGCCMHPLLLMSSVVNKMSQKMAFSTCCVCNAIVNANGDGNAKSPPQVSSRVRQERGMALAAAVSWMAVENHGGESGLLHDDAIYCFYFLCLWCLCVFFISVFSLL